MSNAIAPAIAQLGVQVYLQVVKAAVAAGGAGVFVSPISLFIAMVLALNGAGPGSQTQRELLGVLTQRLNATPSEAELTNRTAAVAAALTAQSSANGSELIVANAVWTNRTAVLKPYADSMKALFQAPVVSVNDSGPINAWAANVTHGLITQAVPPDAKFDLVLTNAVYFKGLWQHAFDKKDTRKVPFTTPSGTVVQADMMSRAFDREERVSFAEAAGQFRAVKLPYRNSTVSAVAVLPDKKAYGLDANALLAGVGLPRLLAGPWQPAAWAQPDLRVVMPKFRVKLDMVPLDAAVRALNVSAPFSPQLADFSRLSDKDLFISSIIQSVTVIVDEVGTEAAAVTSVIMMATSAFMGEPTPPLVFDRPFIFALVDDATGALLFLGTVRDPTKAA